MVTALFGSNPGPRASVCSRLRTVNPAVISKTNESATCITTSAPRNHARRCPPDVSSFSAKTTSERLACSAGTRPKLIPVTTASATTKLTTRQSIRRSSVSAKSVRGSDARATRISAWPIASPNAAPVTESITLSVSNCHASRARVAPMAIRTAISFRRCVARAKSKLARLVHAISRTSSTVSISAPLNAITALRRFGSTNPGGVNRSDIPSSVFGYSCPSCRATVFNCARACSRFIPGFSRPKGSH